MTHTARCRSWTCTILVFLAALIAAPSHAQRVPAAPAGAQREQRTPVTSPAATPALRRAHEVIAIINTGTRADARKYATENIVAARAEMLLGFLSGAQDMT